MTDDARALDAMRVEKFFEQKRESFERIDWLDDALGRTKAEHIEREHLMLFRQRVHIPPPAVERIHKAVQQNDRRAVTLHRVMNAPAADLTKIPLRAIGGRQIFPLLEPPISRDQRAHHCRARRDSQPAES